MQVTFLGSGDAFGSGGRFNTCFLVETQQGRFLVDCGASSLIAMRKFGVDPNAIRTVFISHLHGDHFGGLPFMVLDGQFYSRRTGPLTIVGPLGLRERLKQAMEVFFPGSSQTAQRFEVQVQEIGAGESYSINGVQVTPFLVNHACGAPPFALRLQCDGKVLAYTGDTEWTDSLLSACRGADLLISEALTFDRKIKFHLDYVTLKANLQSIGAKRVLLTHMGPEMLEHLSDVTVEMAEDGKRVDV
jgi:ribonuclease BN (tRNA processing enzyme)